MRECTPSREESRALARTHALIPIYREVLADMLTPVLAYTLLCPPDSPGFLLESVEGGERLARYSFIGYQPKQLELGDGDPLPALRAVAGDFQEPGPHGRDAESDTSADCEIPVVADYAICH